MAGDDAQERGNDDQHDVAHGTGSDSLFERHFKAHGGAGDKVGQGDGISGEDHKDTAHTFAGTVGHLFKYVFEANLLANSGKRKRFPEYPSEIPSFSERFSLDLDAVDRFTYLSE